MFLCGCKLTKKAPFCDGKTCGMLLKDASEELLQPKEEVKNKLKKRGSSNTKIVETPSATEALT